MTNFQEWFTSIKRLITLVNCPSSMTLTDRQASRQLTDAEWLRLTEKVLRECWEVSKTFLKEIKKGTIISNRKSPVHDPNTILSFLSFKTFFKNYYIFLKFFFLFIFYQFSSFFFKNIGLFDLYFTLININSVTVQ